MRQDFAIKLGAAALAMVGNLALAATSATALPKIPAAATSAASLDASQGGIRPAVLELAIPDGMHRAVAHPASDKEQPGSAAKTVQWLSGPVPSRCQHGSTAAPGSHACLVI